MKQEYYERLDEYKRCNRERIEMKYNEWYSILLRKEEQRKNEKLRQKQLRIRMRYLIQRLIDATVMKCEQKKAFINQWLSLILPYKHRFNMFRISSMNMNYKYINNNIVRHYNNGYKHRHYIRIYFRSNCLPMIIEKSILLQKRRINVKYIQNWYRSVMERKIYVKRLHAKHTLKLIQRMRYYRIIMFNFTYWHGFSIEMNRIRRKKMIIINCNLKRIKRHQAICLIQKYVRKFLLRRNIINIIKCKQERMNYLKELKEMEMNRIRNRYVLIIQNYFRMYHTKKMIHGIYNDKHKIYNNNDLNLDEFPELNENEYIYEDLIDVDV